MLIWIQAQEGASLEMLKGERVAEVLNVELDERNRPQKVVRYAILPTGMTQDEALADHDAQFDEGNLPGTEAYAGSLCRITGCFGE